ncbi:MAG: trypsin-like serine protease, partial [Spirochaetales bacterium]
MKTFDTHAFLAVLFPILLLGSCASLKQKEYAVPSFSDLSSGVFRKDIEEGRALEVLQTIQFLRQEASAEETAELDDLYSEALLAAESDFYRAAGENDFRKAISVFSSFITLGVDDRLEGWTLEELRLSFVRYEIDQKRIVPGLLLLEDWFPELEGIITSDELGSFAKYAYEEKQVKLLASLAEAMRTRGLSTPPEYSAQAEGAFPGPDTQKGTVTILVNRGIKLEGGMGYPDQVIGSGFFIDRSGYILTNYHVISSEVDPEYEGFSRLYVRLHSSAKDRIPAKVVGYDRIFDIALLKIEIESPYVFGFTDTKQVNPGDRIFAIGSPGGLENTITSGIVSATGRRFLQMGDTIQVDVPINPGNSGGPLLNDAGELIGLVFAGIEQFEGVNFAIPSYWFRRLIPDLYLGSELVHSWFGLAVNEDNKKLTTMYVLPGGPAFKAGLKRDDIITAVN